MSDFIERLKTDRFLQIIVAVLLFLSFVLLYIFKPFFFPGKTKTTCYQETVKVWIPLREYELDPYFSPFTKFCVLFKIQTKSLEEIKKDLIPALAKGEYPDIVFIDSEFLFRNKDFISTSTPILVDSLIAFYDEDVLNFFNLEKPKTLDDLKKFIKAVRNYNQDLLPVGLGTKEIRNRKEILLSLMSLQYDYKSKDKFRQNFIHALNTYVSFSDTQNEFFSYYEGAGDDLWNFANQKLALYIGFYQDKKEILAINPRINLSYDILPLNTFPPKAKIYTKVFYLAQVKKSKSKAAPHFIRWFSQNQLKKFSEDFDLVPYAEYPDLPQAKKIVLNSAKNFGETFDFINKEKLFDNIDRIIEESKNERELNKILQEIYYSL
jgi:ABC-type glycerol-3-phosphate transport system substrate-binding protein